MYFCMYKYVECSQLLLCQIQPNINTCTILFSLFYISSIPCCYNILYIVMHEIPFLLYSLLRTSAYLTHVRRSQWCGEGYCAVPHLSHWPPNVIDLQLPHHLLSNINIYTFYDNKTMFWTVLQFKALLKVSDLSL